MSAGALPGRLTGHFLAMDGLRGLAALVVVIYHRRFWMGDGRWHGYLAVDFFFVLSGFVIAHAYGAKLADGRMTWRQFILSRIIRLYPMIVFGAVLGALAIAAEGLEKHWLGLVVRALGTLPFAVLALPQPILREPFQPNGPAWSLFFEIIANLIYMAIIPRLGTRWVVAITGVFALALALAIRTHGQVAFGWLWPTMPLGLLRVGFPFTMGVLLQRLHATARLKVPGLPVWVLGPLLVLILAAPIWPTWRGELIFTAVVIFGAFPLMVASASNDQPSARWVSLSTFSAALSYPIYLVHMPIMNIADRIPGFAAIPAWARFAVVIPVCIAGALAAGHWYDKPVRAQLIAYTKRRRLTH